ncbi:salicylate hydroxylase [Arboricoccus pini]|uniref:Salicylate hydroxylase n=1 Tax=Arboricoccus pini TaxID=1963835 RepID=A0A212RNH1_9PROT|nr:FAD-dependent monooxygenase [Arboricoccus pini]SNB73996.1 salicylate hydroxylase [Arboricoccus pini]
MSNGLRIGIIGGGIGGATLARSLERQGIDYHLFERASAFGDVGAGVQMTPNAVKVLRALGLEGALEASGFLPEAMVGRNGLSGAELFRTPLKASCQALFGAPFYHVHRADLHAFLIQDIPASRTTLGSQCVGVREAGSSAIALFADGSSFEADLIVGADGVRSAVRAALWGDEPATYTGHMCWRALVPVEHHPLPFVGPDAAFWLGPRGHVVTYYVKGGAMVNIVAVSESPSWVEESWTIKSSRAALLAGFSGWHEDLVRLFERTDAAEIYEWGLFDREPMAAWSRGHATILGDAAHPMLPFLSQGAAMAMEDAYVLARALAHYSTDVQAALAAYEGERLARTARAQQEARERGRTYHMASAAELEARDRAFKAAEAANPNAVGIKAEWVYQYDATSCAERFAGKCAA